MMETTITLSDELEATVRAYREEHPDAPPLEELARVALAAYLQERGYPASPRPRRVLRITPAPYHADDATDVSENRDAFPANRPRRVFNLPIAPLDADDATDVSENHDYYFAKGYFDAHRDR